MLWLTAYPAFAEDRFHPSLLGPGPTGQSVVSEFVYKNDSDDILIEVYLLGSVQKPGLYHVPLKTDLVTILALSGGTAEDANLDEILLKHRQANGQFDIKKISLENEIAGKSPSAPLFANNDVVLVKPREPSVSNNTVVLVGILSAIAGIIVSGVVVSQALRK
jgi:hypothetical protein